jgi:hypothetical protein
MLNLEPLAAQSAPRMVTDDAKKAENLITKASAVLAEQGIYAFGLFLASRKGKEARQAGDIDSAIRKLLTDAKLFDNPGRIGMGEYYGAIGKSREKESAVDALRRILLTKQLMETALNYGRYHAKAQGGNE